MTYNLLSAMLNPTIAYLRCLPRYEDCLCLLHCNASAAKCPPFHFQVHSPVAGDVFYSDMDGLRKHNPRRHSAVPAQASSVGDELVFSLSWYNHVSSLLCQLHWLKARQRIDFKFTLLVYKFQLGEAPSYLTDQLSQLADLEVRRRLCSASSSLIVHHMWLLIIDDEAFPVTAAHVWNSLLQQVMSAP